MTPLKEPLTPEDARRLIQRVLTSGSVTFSGHAEIELQNDGLSTLDAVNVLRGGVVDAPELVKGSWRYRVRTRQIAVVVAFRSETELRVITAWRIKT